MTIKNTLYDSIVVKNKDGNVIATISDEKISFLDGECTVDVKCANLENYPTCQMVEELCRREGVEKTIASPYERATVSVDGPATVLVVTD